MKLGILLIAAFVAACDHSGRPAITAQPADGLPAPLPVVPSTTVDARACTQLAAIGCAEAKPARGTCADVFSHARTNEVVPGTIDKVAACLQTKATAADARACGNQLFPIECPGR